MRANKRGVSLMVGYALLIVIAIGLAAVVYPFLKARLPEERVECPADLSISIEEASCNRADWSVTVRMLNRGLFNITGAYIRFAEADRSVRPQINVGRELFLTGSINPRPLGPGQYTPDLSYSVGDLSSLPQDGDFVVEVQPAIFRKGVLVPCSNKIITQTIPCISQFTGWLEDDTEDEFGCDGSWDSMLDCSMVHDGNWDTYGTAVDSLATYYANYTRPLNAIEGSNWTIKFRDEEYLSIDIPVPCLNSETVQFKIDLNHTPITPRDESISFSCFNNGASLWMSLHTRTRGSPPDEFLTNLYEEKVWWKLRS